MGALSVILSIIQSIALILVACAGAGIAYQQMLTARTKLRLDLFDKRYAVYQMIRKSTNEVFQSAEVKFSDVTNFRRAIQDAPFLFGQEIVDHLELLYTKMTGIYESEAWLKGSSQDSRSKSHYLNDKQRLLVELLEDDRELARKLEMYMKFYLLQVPKIRIQQLISRIMRGLSPRNSP